MPEIRLTYPLPEHLHAFQSMIALACSALRQEPECASAIVLGVQSLEYCLLDVTPESFDEQISAVLTTHGKTRVQKILYLRGDGTIEVPPYALRDLLCRINSRNLNAEMLVTDERGYATVALGRTLYWDHGGK